MLRLKRSSLEGSELGRSGSTHSDLTVLDGLVGQGELGQVVTNHFSLHFGTVPVLATVHINHRSYHFGDDDAVSEMSFNSLGLLSIWGFLLGLLKAPEEAFVPLMDTVSESSPLSGLHELDKLVHW